jgi:hypothetical protein
MYRIINRAGNRFARLLALVLLLLVSGSVPVADLESHNSTAALRVLFIGNSLTYSNDLPSIVQAFAEAAAQKPAVFKAVVFGGYSLEDHWNQGDSRAAIAKGGWDFVVLQQGPSASADGRKSLLDYARVFDREIRKVGATPALYMVWPSSNRQQDFDGVSRSYSLAAGEVKGLLLPAGDAWRIAWKLDSQLELYSPDGLHPTPTGSYLAALVIYAQLFKSSPVGLPAKLKLRPGARIEIPPERARLLQDAAGKAIEGLPKS